MRSFIGWVGGKSRLAEKIVSIFPEHRTYVEVFGGAGWVLFKKEPSKVEVYNDVYGLLVNLFRVVKHRPAELAEAVSLQLYSRKTYFEYLKTLNDPVDCEVVRAARFYLCVKMSFGSKVGMGWGYSKVGPATTLIDRKHIEAVSERLRRVYIENGSFEKLIPAYDSPGTLFYCDPPYWIYEKCYEHQFEEKDHHRLAEVLRAVKGRVVVSYNDSRDVRRLYDGFKIRRTSAVRYTLNNRPGRAAREKRELLITNF